ncbi:MAG: SGNH/GDSL hydrolase family protein [Rhodobacteraceae bacterium]|nr:MAG: SGNH/GDSL hydrolase family protein [Paracoccaceae bacterium]
MGDSLMASHSSAKASVSHGVEARLGEPVVDRSVSGARMINALPISSALGMRISEQFTPGRWDWVILNGGGNDLWLGCGCMACDRRMTRMISPDGREGDIVRLVDRLRATGARVIYVGYLRSPGQGSPIEHCRDEGDELEARIARMAAADGGVHFLSLKDMVPHGDLSYHAPDRIHPSPKASRAIAERIARIISDAEAPS